MNATTNGAPQDCPKGQACFYEDFEYVKRVRAQTPTEECITLSTAFTSVYNNSDQQITVWDSDKGCWGDQKTIEPHEGEPRLEFRSYSFRATDN